MHWIDLGTRLEHRFTKSDVISMMEMAGLSNIVISDSVPYYCAVGIKIKCVAFLVIFQLMITMIQIS